MGLSHNQVEKPTFPTDTVVQEGIEPSSPVNQTDMLTVTPPYHLFDIRYLMTDFGSEIIINSKNFLAEADGLEPSSQA